MQKIHIITNIARRYVGRDYYKLMYVRCFFVGDEIARFQLFRHPEWKRFGSHLVYLLLVVVVCTG